MEKHSYFREQLFPKPFIDRPNVTSFRLGLKVILDFIPNHTSDQHEWFVQSENGSEKYKDYYVWKEGSQDMRPNGWVTFQAREKIQIRLRTSF